MKKVPSDDVVFWKLVKQQKYLEKNIEKTELRLEKTEKELNTFHKKYWYCEKCGHLIEKDKSTISEDGNYRYVSCPQCGSKVILEN